MQRFLTSAGLVVAVLVPALAVYGTAIEPRLVLEERRETIEIPSLGGSWTGQQVAVFSDLQVGMWWDNVDMIERVVDRVVDLHPAAVLIPGDFIYGSESVEQKVATVGDVLQPLADAGIPTFAVLGNHDHESGGAEEVRAQLAGMGIEVLENESVALDPPAGGGDPLHLVGLAATRPGLTDVDAALDGLADDDPRVVMVHNPEGYLDLPAGSAPFTVAGHTHCGQIAAPATPDWSYLALTQEDEVVADGFAPEDHGAAGNTLFVTCGIGFSIVPVRINAPPQLLVVTLVAAP